MITAFINRRAKTQPSVFITFLMNELSLNNLKVTRSPFLLRLLLFIQANCRWSFGPALEHAPWPFHSDQGPVRSFQARMALLNQSVALRPALFVLFTPVCWAAC